MYDVVKYLETFGYEVKDTPDSFILTNAFEKVRQIVRNECNTPDIPDGLKFVVTEMVLGEFLLIKKTFSPDELTNFDLNAAVKSIKVGDTDTVFALGEGTATPEQRLTAFIDALKGSGKSQFTAYRRLRW